MPLYGYKCKVGHEFDRFLRLADYAEPQTCECGEGAVKQLSAPAFMVDFPAYQSPTSGKWISSRTQRREDLIASDCVEYEPSMKQEAERKKKKEEAELDKAVESIVDEQISALPTRRREKLVSELESGVDINVVRV